MVKIYVDFNVKISQSTALQPWPYFNKEIMSIMYPLLLIKFQNFEEVVQLKQEQAYSKIQIIVRILLIPSALQQNSSTH